MIQMQAHGRMVYENFSNADDNHNNFIFVAKIITNEKDYTACF